jgi:hypothetical protein
MNRACSKKNKIILNKLSEIEQIGEIFLFIISLFCNNSKLKSYTLKMYVSKSTPTICV